LSHFRLLILSLLVIGELAISASFAQETFTYQVDYLQEAPQQPISLTTARAMFERGEAKGSDSGLLSFGVGSPAVWVRIKVNNPTDQLIHKRLTTSVTWVNYLDLYQVQANGHITLRSSGDALPRTQELLPGIGIVFNVQLPVGESEFYIRAQAHDPIVLPIQFLSLEEVADSDILSGMLYGILYGILLTLLGYNLILYRSLKQTNFVFYAIYIGSFIVLNTGYNGYLFAWLHPSYPLLQNYFTLNIMVLHSVLGLVFSLSFLDVKRHRPKCFKLVLLYIGLGILSILAATVLQWHLLAALIAFSYLSLSTVVMVALGLLHLSLVAKAQHFVLAVSASMLGLFTTAATSAGLIPFTYLGYHAAEFGVLLEAMVLAYILSVALKVKESARLKAEYLAAYDPLTNLLNRRSFFSLASQKIEQHKAEGVPLSLVVMDLDHFKKVNDAYGHHVGDEALKHVANILQNNTRKDDLVGRFGGEEIVILLPKDDCQQASLFTERLRKSLEKTPLASGGMQVYITASFGVVELGRKMALDELIKEADTLLYQAKKNGRNQVASATFSKVSLA